MVAQAAINSEAAAVATSTSGRVMAVLELLQRFLGKIGDRRQATVRQAGDIAR